MGSLYTRKDSQNIWTYGSTYSDCVVKGHASDKRAATRSAGLPDAVSVLPRVRASRMRAVLGVVRKP